MLLLAATVCFNTWFAIHYLPRDLWLGFCVSQLSLLAWWVAPLQRGWEMRFWPALAGGAILVGIGEYHYGIYQGVMWLIWHSAIVFFLIWVFRSSSRPIRNPRSVRLRSGVKHIFVLTTLVAIGFATHNYGRDHWKELSWTLEYDSRDGQIISGIVLGIMIPSLYVRRFSADLVSGLTLFLTFIVTSVCIVLGAYSWDPCVHSETIDEVTSLNLAQAFVYVIWLTGLRDEADWRDGRSGTDGA